MTFTFDVDAAARKQGSPRANPANHANPRGEISSFSSFSMGEGVVWDESPLPNSNMEARRQNVLQQLKENPNAYRAYLIDERADPDAVIVAVAIRDLATFEMRVPKAKADAWAIAALVDKHSIRPADEKPVARPGEPAGIPGASSEKATA